MPSPNSNVTRIDRPPVARCGGGLVHQGAVHEQVEGHGSIGEVIEAFNRNDLARVAAFTDPRISYTIHGRNRLAGTFRGIDALVKAKESSGGTASLVPRVVLADGEHVMMYGRHTGERDGRRTDYDHAYLYGFADGELIEGHTIPVDRVLADAFWG